MYSISEFFFYMGAYYWQHCTQRKVTVFMLLRGRFWDFSPRDDTLHQ